MQKRNTILICDVSSLVHQMPKSMEKLTTSSGIPTGHVYSFVKKLLEIKSLPYNIQSVLFALDSGYTHRLEIDPEYKANRRKRGSRGSIKVDDVFPLVESLPVLTLRKEGLEADDIIYTVVKRLHNDFKIVILSKDYDISYLLRLYPNVRHLFTFNQEITPSGIFLRFGVEPKFIPVYKALFGDASDNIKHPLLGRERSKILTLLPRLGIDDINVRTLVNNLDEDILKRIITNWKVIQMRDALSMSAIRGSGELDKLKSFLDIYEIKAITGEDLLSAIPYNKKLLNKVETMLGGCNE